VRDTPHRMEVFSLRAENNQGWFLLYRSLDFHTGRIHT